MDKRATDIINRLNKTKKEAYPDLGKEREAWDREQRSLHKSEQQVGSARSNLCAC